MGKGKGVRIYRFYFPHFIDTISPLILSFTISSRWFTSHFSDGSFCEFCHFICIFKISLNLNVSTTDWCMGSVRLCTVLLRKAASGEKQQALFSSTYSQCFLKMGDFIFSYPFLSSSSSMTPPENPLCAKLCAIGLAFILSDPHTSSENNSNYSPAQEGNFPPFSLSCGR